jgi:hypothetical protein
MFQEFNMQERENSLMLSKKIGSLIKKNVKKEERGTSIG